MADVSVVQITVWLDAEQTIGITANGAIAGPGGDLVQPCRDPMDFSRTQVAQGASGADIRALFDEVCGKLSQAITQSGKTIQICTKGAKIVTCRQP